jgi:two-component system copper resistance phosphate regulon response regulator CusR
MAANSRPRRGGVQWRDAKIDVDRRCTGRAACQERSFAVMRILLAEDDRQLRLSISRGLREASYAVDQAGTGIQALSLASANQYDALILDVLLPGKSGVDVCSELRRGGNAVPILILTALDGVDSRIEGLDAGADDYLTKPFDFGELLARLRALTRRRGPVASATVEVGDLVIDTLRRSVRRNQREIALTGKEFAFLLHLARNAGRVIDRAELMEHVWDDAQNTYSNIIDVYASRLRRKIDDGEKVALFKTIRGTGFMLDAPSPSRRTAPIALGRARSSRERG